jgi:hypothetical protein
VKIIKSMLKVKDISNESLSEAFDSVSIEQSPTKAIKNIIIPENHVVVRI